MKRLVTALLSGLVFGLGLTISGMGNPAKVLAFLDITGVWDPSLAFVLAGAAGLSALAFGHVLKRERPILAPKFNMPVNNDVDVRLVVGGGLFGIGWGLVGFCPGPVFTTLLLGRWESYVFFAAMIAGMAIYQVANAYGAGRSIRGGITS